MKKKVYGYNIRNPFVGTRKTDEKRERERERGKMERKRARGVPRVSILIRLY